MSYSVGVRAKRENATNELEAAFEKNYGSAHDAVRAQAMVGIQTVAEFCETTEDEGEFSVSLSGHSQQADPGSSRDWMTVNIQPVT